MKWATLPYTHQTVLASHTLTYVGYASDVITNILKVSKVCGHSSAIHEKMQT